MGDSSRSTPFLPILVAVIGVVGSVAVAYLTTRAKFSDELQGKGSEVSKLKHDLEVTEQRLSEKHKELDAKIAAVDDRLRKLDTQIDIAVAAGEKLAKYGGRILGGLIGGDK